jgi:hypothetical protein
MNGTGSGLCLKQTGVTIVEYFLLSEILLLLAVDLHALNTL